MFQVDRKGDLVTLQFKFTDIMAAEKSQKFEGHREFVAWMFKRRGYIVTNFPELRHETWQDGPKHHMNITHKIFGRIGQSLMVDDAPRNKV